MVVLITCKYEEEPIKIGHKSTIWSNLLVRDIIVALVTCKYEEVPTKTEGVRVLTRFPIATLWKLSVAMDIWSSGLSVINV